MNRSQLDDCATRIEQIKSLVNVQWQNTAHPAAIDDERGIEAFDQLMDQVLKVLNCYQEVLPKEQDVPEKIIQRAKDAHIECVKAACGFLESIASKLVERERSRVKGLGSALSKDIRELYERVQPCAEQIQEARQLWEDNKPDGLERLKTVIKDMDKIADLLDLSLPVAIQTEQRVETLEQHSKWRLVGQWVAIIVAIALGGVNLIYNLSSKSKPEPDTPRGEPHSLPLVQPKEIPSSPTPRQ